MPDKKESVKKVVTKQAKDATPVVEEAVPTTQVPPVNADGFNVAE